MRGYYESGVIHLSGDHKVDALFMDVETEGELADNDRLEFENWLDSGGSVLDDIDAMHEAMGGRTAG